MWDMKYDMIFVGNVGDRGQFAVFWNPRTGDVDVGMERVSDYLGAADSAAEAIEIAWTWVRRFDRG